MANVDLSKGKYSIDDLKRTFDNFLTPEFRIKVGNYYIGNGNSKSKVFLNNLSIKLSTDAAASLNFSILNAYDENSRQILDEVKSKVKLGEKVSVEIGYVSCLVEIFKGYIYSIDYEYLEQLIINVTALDFIRLMQENNVEKRIFIDKTPTEVFQEIMKDYKKVCSTSDIKIDASQSEKQKLTQNGSDYDFIKQVLCKKECRDFYVLNGKAYFVDAENKKNSVLTLEFQKEIIRFSFESKYLYKKIQASTTDKSNPQNNIKYSETIRNSTQTNILSTPSVKNISLKSSGTTKDIMSEVQKAVEDEKRQMFQCSCTCIGIPYIVPARSLNLKKIDSGIDGEYEIISVEHQINSDTGYITNIQLGGRND